MDAGILILATVGTFLFSSAFDWDERIVAISASFERWQLDELPQTAIVFASGLVWYGFRRRTELTRLLSRNRELAQQLLMVQENERRAIARELHDEIAQHCTSIRLDAAYLQREGDASRIAAAGRRIDATAQLMHEGMRDLLRRLRPVELDELGLPCALEVLCEAWQRRSGTICSYQCEGDAGVLEDEVGMAVYRVAQEALSNIARHAAARRVEVMVEVGDRALSLIVEDDGCGFDESRPARGFGLLGAQERAAALGGRLDLKSTSGAGTRLHLSIPLQLRPA